MAFGDFGNTTGDAQLILDNTGSTGVGDNMAFAAGANYARTDTEAGLNQQDVFGNRSATLDGNAIARGDEVLTLSQQGLGNSNGVYAAGSSQTANSSSVKSASSSASAHLVLPNSFGNINFGKRRKRSAPLVDSYKFTQVCFFGTTTKCQLHLAESGPKMGTNRLHSLSQDQFVDMLTQRPTEMSDELIKLPSKSNTNV
uniref:Uncharacterized protein n=1 Tax=Plectus sambesii TaxID=2011161 RepID=A0A914WIW0_9BILA